MRARRVKRNRGWLQKLKFWRKPKKTFPWKMWLGGSILTGLLLVTTYTIFFLPDVRGADQLSFAESTIIYARGALEPAQNPNDHILYTIHGDENREYIPLEEISPWVKEATIAIEDDGFYRHFGFDVGGIVKGALNHFFGLGTARGGSTITQQLVKNTFLNNDRSIIRKVNELLLSVKLEFTYSKDDILELYLNKIPYGNNAFGIEAAAKTYFNKSARDLTIAEASILASIPVAPSRFNPFGSNKDLLLGFYEMENSFRTEAEARAAEEASEEDENKIRVYKKGRKDLVLQRMLSLEMISQSQFQQAWAEASNIEFKTAKSDIRAPHFVFYVRERLEEKYGKEFLNQGGLRIYTTLDMEAQTAAEETIAAKTAHYENTYGAKNVALAAIENGSGEIRVYVGGKDFFDEKNDGQVDVLTSSRQPGSSFKPFVYAAGFDQGYGPATVVFDSETDFGNGYTPQNFNENFAGPVSLRQALNASLNIPAIKMAVLATPTRVLALASSLGIKYEGDTNTHGVAIGVGVAEVEPLSHINAFQTFAGDGSWYEPTAILEIRNADDQLLEKTDIDRRKQDGINPEVVALVRNIMTDETTRPTTDGFDWNKLLQLKEYNNGAKTGTSNRVAHNPNFDEEIPESDENKKFITVPGDSWTIGFTPHLVTGVWVGNNRGAPMKSGATGLTVAAPVWKSFTESAHEILDFDPDQEYEESEPLKTFEINKFSGLLATDDTPESLRVNEVFANFSLPTKEDSSLQEVEINVLTGLPADDETPKPLVQAREVLVLESIRPDFANWQRSVDEWLETHPNFIHTLGENREEEWDLPAPEALLNLNRQERKESLRERLLRLRRLESGTLGPAPEVRILSPADQTEIAPGRIEIRTSIVTPVGIEAVEFYFDDQLVDEAVNFPYTGKFNLPASFPSGSSHIIRVVAVDDNYQVGTTETEVIIGQDTSGPNILFLAPVGTQEVPLNSLYEIQVEVVDGASALSEVQFWLGDDLLGVLESGPYRWQVLADGALGRKYVRVVARDVQGNTSEKSVPVSYVREKLISGADPVISRVLSKRNSLALELTFPTPESISGARIVVERNGKNIYTAELEQVTKTAQLSLPRTLTRGSAVVKLQTNGPAWETVDTKSVNF